MHASESQVKLLSDLLQAETGIFLGSDKAYLVHQRLVPVAEAHGLPGVGSAIVTAVQGAGIVRRDVIEAMTINESYFFRNAAVFEALRRVILPRLIATRRPGRRLRIWSAACADGQEPYSLAMLVDEFGLRRDGWSVDILATDLSIRALDKARAATYSHFEVQRGLPARLLVRHFSKTGPDSWRLAPEIAGTVDFRPHNLMTDGTRFGKFDLILCRNVLIYFAVAEKTAGLRRLAACLAPDGALALGGAESVFGLPVPLEAIAGAPCWFRMLRNGGNWSGP